MPIKDLPFLSLNTFKLPKTYTYKGWAKKCVDFKNSNFAACVNGKKKGMYTLRTAMDSSFMK